MTFFGNSSHIKNSHNRIKAIANASEGVEGDQAIALVGHTDYPQITQMTQIWKEQDGDVVGYDLQSSTAKVRGSFSVRSFMIILIAFSLLRNLRNLRIDSYRLGDAGTGRYRSASS